VANVSVGTPIEALPSGRLWVPRMEAARILSLAFYGDKDRVSAYLMDRLVREGLLEEMILPPVRSDRKYKWGRRLISRESLIRLLEGPPELIRRR